MKNKLTIGTGVEPTILRTARHFIIIRPPCLDFFFIILHKSYKMYTICPITTYYDKGVESNNRVTGVRIHPSGTWFELIF